jgi:hypothetical protein
MNDVVTFDELVYQEGPTIADQALGHRRHFLDESGQAYWDKVELDDLLGLIKSDQKNMETRDQ